MIENCWVVNETFRSYEFELTIPQKSLLRIQVWDWDLASSNDKIDETSVDIENRWFSSHRATCGLSNEMTGPISLPTLSRVECGLQHLARHEEARRYFQWSVSHSGEAMELAYRRVPHEFLQEYIRQNNALVALPGWGRQINEVCRRLIGVSFSIRNRPWSPSTSNVVRCSIQRIRTITPPKPVPYQLWLTIWNTSDVELNDENIITEEKASDICVKACILGKKDDAQQTDIHYRSAFSWIDPWPSRTISIHSFCLTSIISKSKRRSFTRRKIPSFKWETSRRNCRRESSFVSAMLIFS